MKSDPGTADIVRELSPPSRGAWIEITGRYEGYLTPPSPPSRGAWIEIMGILIPDGWAEVAPLAGGVD